MFILKQLVFSSGERFPMLHDENGSPDFWATLYTSNKLRQQTQTSITSILNSINHFYKWQIAERRDIFQEIFDGNVPDAYFVHEIKDFCSLKDEHIQKHYFSNKKSNVINFTQLKLATISVLNLVSVDFQTRRMSDISNFINFVGREIVRRKSNADELLGKLHDLGRVFKVIIPKSRYSRGNVKLQHAEKEAFDEFLQLFELDTEKNPFKNDDIKIRNQILMKLLFWTGFRSGEVLSMTLDDINYDTENPTVSVKRMHDDKDDSRKKQPVAKTVGREIAIPPKLRDMIDYYIFNVRSKFDAAKKHPYLFVSQKGKTSGQPLTDSTFYNRVVSTAKKIDIETFELIKRHGYRHYFNERLSEKIDESNIGIHLQIGEALQNNEQVKASYLRGKLISEKQEVEMRMMLNGHTSESSAKPYIERHAKRKAQRVHKEMMQDISQKIQKISKDKK